MSTTEKVLQKCTYLQCFIQQVSYSLVPDKYDASLKFRIDPQTGLITTNTTFDREEQKVYYISVMAKDGTDSDVPYHEPANSPNSGRFLLIEVF
jgi:hypothetical protein